MIVCSLVTSVSCCFSFFLSLMVPRFRWEYTLLARFFVDGAVRRLCCIIRTHSSMRASLTNNMSEICKNARRKKNATCANHNTTVSKQHLGIFDSVELPMVPDLPHWHRSSLEGTTTYNASQYFCTTIASRKKDAPSAIWTQYPPTCHLTVSSHYAPHSTGVSTTLQ